MSRGRLLKIVKKYDKNKNGTVNLLEFRVFIQYLLDRNYNKYLQEKVNQSKYLNSIVCKL